MRMTLGPALRIWPTEASLSSEPGFLLALSLLGYSCSSSGSLGHPWAPAGWVLVCMGRRGWQWASSDRQGQ